MKYLLLFLVITFCFASCNTKNKQTENSAFSQEKAFDSGNDFDKILEGGELLITTLSSPDTYYEYRGLRLGLQYTMVSDFASSEGLLLQIDEATDTTELVNKLNDGDVDLICIQLPEKYIEKQGLLACGAKNVQKNTSWATRKELKGLAKVLDTWFDPSKEKKAISTNKKNFAERNFVRRRVSAPFLSKEKGIISPYDEHFKKASAKTGWDWRLIAAQSYQESCFDPQAVSWAGAKGLMQIMPGTASEIGISSNQIFNPEQNVSAAARLIKTLNDKFRDIRDPNERVKFVLASYNGGYAHIRDAMALTRKHGLAANEWEYVGQYVLKLAQPEYYRDPIVKHGYMIGSETFGYVNSILQRYKLYGGKNLSTGFSGELHSVPERATKKNRFTTTNKILGPDEL